MIFGLPWWLLVFWLPIAFLLARYFYKPIGWISELSKKSRILLITLRTLVLAILGFLLLGVLYESISTREEKPIFFTLLDESASMLKYKDSALIKTKTKTLLNELATKFKGKYEFVDYSFGSKIIDKQKFQFRDQKTDMSEPFDYIRNLYGGRNIGGILMISDGNFNVGSSPIYASERLKFTPVFTIGVGDTAIPKDQIIKSVMSNEFAFLKNQFPVEIDLETYKIKSGNVNVSISLNGVTKASKVISYKNEDYQYNRISFLIEGSEIGVNRMTVQVSPVNGEQTLVNNSITNYIEIIDSRSKLLILAGAPHPDVAALKSAFETDENIEVKVEIVKDWDKSLTGIDLVVWHDPGMNYDQNCANVILNSKKSLLYVFGAGTSNATIQKLGLELRIPAGNRIEEVQPALNSGFNNFVLSDKLTQLFALAPPLKVKSGTFTLPKSAEILVFQKVGNIQKQDPLVFFAKSKNGKYGVISGEGIWRWRLNENLKTGDQKEFNNLMNSIRQYLTVRDNVSALRVSPPKQAVFGEVLQFKAEFYNESMELITTPKINLVIKDASGKTNKNEFAVMQNFYSLNLSGYKSGLYTWTASTSHKGKQYSKSGNFIIEDLKLEDQNTFANHTSLKQLALNSNGKYVSLNKYQTIFEELQTRKDITTVAYKESLLKNLIDYKLWFFILFVLIASEWTLRRWFGGY